MSSNNNSAVIITAVIGANGQPLPLTGNSLGSGFTLPVKQERHDEAEIQELAAKMMETQKAALAKQQQQAAQIANRQMAGGMQTHLPNPMTGQTNILNFLSRQKIVTNGNGTIASTNGKSPAAATTCGIDIHNSGAEKKPCDEESQKGHFGWTSFGKIHIPYIFRQTEKYCGVRMIELKLLGKYLNCLHPDIYSSCTCVRSYYITEAESRLLNEINHKHCDGEFGREYFTLKDLVVRLSDATKFFQFLDICYRKLVAGNKTPSEKCGFIRINKESVVPYTVRNNEQVVPLFYFEGETENLKQKADYLSGWDLAYLKFCCKVQGIRNELFSSESVAVISLTDIKSYFPNGTEFEDYWPSKVVDSNLLVGNRGNNVSNSSVNWTRQPTAPPPKVISTPSGMSQKSLQQQQQHQQQQQNAQSQIIKRTTGGGSNSVPGASNASSAFAAQSAAAAAVAIQNQGAAAQRMHATNALAATQAVQALTNGWMSGGGNLPMIHAQMLATQAQQNHPSSRNQYRNPMENLMLNNRQTYTSYSNGSISMQPVNSHTQGNAPPPLVRSATGQSTNHMSSCNTVEQTIQQQCASMVSFNYGHQPQPASYQSNNHNSIPHIQHNSPPPSHPYHHTHKNSQFNILNSNAKSLSNQQQKLSSSSSSTVTHVPPAANSYSAPPHINPSCSPNVMIPPARRPNFNDSFLSELPNLSAWHQLNEKQKLLLTQQLKNNNNTSVCSNKNSNPNLYMNDKTFSGKFMKPGVPPLIPMTVLDKPTASRTNTSYNSSQKISPHISSSDTLEEFERRFKMTEEMKAVVQKVLSNPDLSTFIQTNSSNTFVPFISPPISPAIGVSPSSTSVSSSSSSSSSSTGLLASSHPVFHNASLTIVPSPNIQSQHSLSLHHYPVSSSSSSPSYSNSNSIIAPRQKSVICSTSAIVVPSCTTTPSPSPTRASSAASATTTTTMEVIDLSSPRRSLQAATAYIQQQQAAQHVQHQHQQAAAAAAVAQQTQQQQLQQQQQQRITSQQHQHQQQNGSSRSSSNSSNSNAANAASMHLQRHAAAVVAGVSDISLRVIPEIPTGNVNIQPYKVQKVFVENNMVPCINMKAYTDSDQLMTLSDFREYFFPTVPLEHCKRLIEALGVELYKGNRRQIQVLMENGRSHSENIPLVQVRDIIKYMPQLTFMIRNQEQPPTKRSRVS